MKVELLKKEDYKEAIRLYNDGFDKNLSEIKLEPLGDVLGLYNDKELIGIVELDHINNIFENKKIAFINSFCIKEEFRNKGYGKYFLNYIINYLKEKDINIINMTSNKTRVYAHKLYNDCNFEVVDTVLLKKDI